MSDVLLSKPWRQSNYLSLGFPTKKAIKQRLKDDIINYKPLHDLMPPLHIFPQVNIVLFGAAGAGKSSVFNTISSLYKGKIFNIARCGRSVRSVTTKLTKFQIVYGSIAEQLRLTLWDTVGIDANHLMTSGNMRYLLEGKLPDRYPLDPSREISSQSPQLVNTPTLLDLGHCVATVVDVSTVDQMQDEVQDNICAMQIIMNSLEVPHIVLLTHIDKVSNLVAGDATKAFKSQKVKESVDKTSKLFGLPRNAIFVMKCYEEESDLDDNVDIMALIALKGILDYCDAYLYRVYDTVKAVASKQATIAEENKSLKKEQLELESINNAFRNQLSTGLIKVNKLKTAYERSVSSPTDKKRKEDIEKKRACEKLMLEVNNKETAIAKMREQRNRLKEEISIISGKK